MSELVHDIDFGSTGNSQSYVVDGIGTPEGEGGHSWSFGLQSQLRFTLLHPAEPHFLVLRVKPWLHPPEVLRQRIMLGLDDHLLGIIDVVDDCVLTFAVPPGGTDRTLSIGHIDSPRSAEFDVYRNGRSMGLMMRWLRVFRSTPRPAMAAHVLPPVETGLVDGELFPAIRAMTGMTMAQMMGRFESLGEWCFFGVLQQQHGADHPGLLRFAGLHLPDLVHGLVRRFDGIGQAGRMEVFRKDASPDLFDVHDHTYRVWWPTGRSVYETTPEAVIESERVRLPYLQRKFAKTLAAGQRIFVLTRPASDIDASAVFMALDLWARNTLLFVTDTGAHAPGTVERLANGLLRGTIDCGEDGRGSEAVWLSILANACLLQAM